jgi:AAA15 family ATPase/GTPase
MKIKRYKCFKDFEVNGFKRINLIGGKNNIGKTAFLEALEEVV